MAITHGYCTLAQLRTELGIGDTDDDATLELVIGAVSRLIDDYCERRFYAVAETRYYTAGCGSSVLVDDLLSVSELATDQDGDRVYETTWATTDFDLRPDNAAADGKPYWEITVAPCGSYTLPAGIARGVKVSGSFGYSATTPEVVQQACLFQCALSARGKDAPFGVSGAQDGGFRQEIQSAGLHPFARRMLEPYRRLSVG